MTVVHFDEPALHVDTDAAGEPCVVSSDRVPFPPRSEIRNVLVASELSTAYAANDKCFVCLQAIATVHDAAFLTTQGRVVHTDRCLAQYIANRFGFLGARTREALSRHDEALMQHTQSRGVAAAGIGSAADVEAELYRVIDHAVSDPTYGTVVVPESLSAAQRRRFVAGANVVIGTGVANIVFDFSGTRTADGSGLSCLVQLHHAYRATTPAGRMFLIGLTDDLRDLLQLTRLETLFTIVNTLAEAEDAIRG